MLRTFLGKWGSFSGGRTNKSLCYPGKLLLWITSPESDQTSQQLFLLQVGKAIQTDHTSQQYVYFPDVSAACMTQVEPCVPTGGSLAFWVYVIDCPRGDVGILSSWIDPGGTTGFIIRHYPSYTEYETLNLSFLWKANLWYLSHANNIHYFLTHL